MIVGIRLSDDARQFQRETIGVNSLFAIVYSYTSLVLFNIIIKI